MRLPALGIEYVTFRATADFVLDGTLEVTITETDDEPGADASWAAAAWSDVETIATNGDHVRPFEALLAGSAVAVPGSATQLSAGVNYVWVRLTDTPEVIIRPAGRITAS